MASSSTTSTLASSYFRGIGRGRGSLRRDPTSFQDLQVKRFLGVTTDVQNGRNAEAKRDADSLEDDRFDDAISSHSSSSFYSLSSSGPSSPPEQLELLDRGERSQRPSSSSSSTIFYDCLTQSSPSTVSDFESQSDVYEDETSETNELSALRKPDRFEEFSVNLERKVNHGRGIDLQKKMPPGIPTRVKVVGVLKPLCIFIQTAGNAAKVESLKLQLKGRVLKKMKREEISEGVYVVVKYQDELYRGQVEEVVYFSEKCWIRLVDTGLSVLRPFPFVFKLPSSFLKIIRQVISVTMWGVEPTNETKLFSYLQSHLVGKVVSLEITHSYLDCYYYASSVTIDGEKKSLSSTLKEQGLAIPCDVVDNMAKSLTKGFKEFSNYKPPVLELNEVTNVYITNVVSPNHFYVRKRGTEELQGRIEFASRTVLESGSSTSAHHDASRMFIISYNPCTSLQKPCRVFCHELDFTVAPGQARVFLIDFGFTCNIPANQLMEYTRYVSDYPPLAYRVAINAQPINGEWDEETTDCLKDIMNFSQKGGSVQVKCVKQNVTKGKGYVKLQSTEWEMDWNQALQEIGYAKRTLKENMDELHDFGVTIPAPTCSFWEFKRLNESIDIGAGDDGDKTFPFSFTNIPDAVLPTVGDLLKPRRLKGVFLYLVMTQRCYDLHQQLRKHCAQLVASGKSEVGDHVFRVGEVVLAPWNLKTYQRCYISGLENREGTTFATVKAFDIEQTQSFLVSKLKRPDYFVMKVEKLSHVVWLEDTNEDTLVFSQDFDNSIQPFCKWATLINMRVLPNNKLVVRLWISNANQNMVSLTKEIHKLGRWNWEKYFNAGFFSQQRLVTKLYDVTQFEWDLDQFLNGGKYYVDEMLKGSCKVQVRRVELNHSHSAVTIMVIPQTSSVIDDFRALRWQMNRFYEKVSYGNPIGNSLTFPKIVAIRECFDVKANKKLGSPCQWHRSVYIPEKKTLECVDCFQHNEVYINDLSHLESMSEINGLDIREICPEMLKVPPIGKRLSVHLAPGNPRVRKVVQEFLKLGMEIEVCVQKPRPSQQELQMNLCADIPEITKRLFF